MRRFKMLLSVRIAALLALVVSVIMVGSEVEAGEHDAVTARSAPSEWSHRAAEVARERLERFRQRPHQHAGEAPTVYLRPRMDAVRPAPSPGSIELSRFSLAALADEDQPGPIGNGTTDPGPSPPAIAPAEPQSLRIERGPLPGFRETVLRDIREAPGDLWHDTKKVYGNLGNVLFLVGAGGASIALRTSGADDSVEDRYRRRHTMSQGWRDTFDVVGSPGLHFALAGVWYLAGQQLEDDKTYEVAKAMGSALIISGVSTLGLKLAAHTRGPNRNRFAWPSGHTSSSFAMAAVLHNAYGPWVGIPSYGASTLVALQRVDSREHHLSDVIFGAALGWVVAETIMKDRQPRIFGGEIVPYIDPENGGAGVAWVKALGTRP